MRLSGSTCSLTTLVLCISATSVFAENPSIDKLNLGEPGKNSDSLPDIVIPKSVLRARNILKSLKNETKAELPEKPVKPNATARPELPARPEKPDLPERPIALDRSTPPERPQPPQRPGKPDKPSKP